MTETTRGIDQRYCGPKVAKYDVYSETGEYIGIITLRDKGLSAADALREQGFDPDACVMLLRK